MLDGKKISEELRRAADDSVDVVLRHAVSRVHAEGEGYDWVGIYLLNGSHLVLHNYVGKPTEHERIKIGQGVCGTAVAENRDINVGDVRELDNYLACSVETRSEIVVLIKDGERILGQIDIDSDRVNAFHDQDLSELRVVADTLGELLGDKIKGR